MSLSASPRRSSDLVGSLIALGGDREGATSGTITMGTTCAAAVGMSVCAAADDSTTAAADDGAAAATNAARGTAGHDAGATNDHDDATSISLGNSSNGEGKILAAETVN